MDTTATLIVRRRLQDDGAWRAVYETLEGLLEQFGCRGAVIGPRRIEVAMEA